MRNAPQRATHALRTVQDCRWRQEYTNGTLLGIRFEDRALAGSLTGPFGSRFLLVNSMLHEAQWAQALLSAIDDYLSKKTGGAPAPVPAAPLKPLLARHAELLGLTFPPEGHERIKFVDFLDLFPGTVKTQRRPGQDALVAKIADAHVLEEASKAAEQLDAARLPRTIRQDVFQAFTMKPPVGSDRHWYSRELDKFLQAPAGADEGWLPVPTPTLEMALADRRAFAEAQPAAMKEALLAALNQPTSQFEAFGLEIKRQLLGRAWHLFRLRRVVMRATEWAKSQGLTWNPSWERASESTGQESNSITARETNAFLAGLMQLGPEDAKRVMVPLDIVLRLLRRD